MKGEDRHETDMSNPSTTKGPVVGCYRNAENEHLLPPGCWPGAGRGGVVGRGQKTLPGRGVLQAWPRRRADRRSDGVAGGRTSKSKHEEAWRHLSCLEKFSKYTYSEEAPCRAQVTQGLWYQQGRCHYIPMARRNF